MRTTWRPPVKPPVGAAYIDWSHPLARGLTSAWVMNEGTGDLHDLVRGVVAFGGPAAFGKPTFTAGIDGLATKYVAASSQCYETTGVTSLYDAPAHSTFARVQLNASGAAANTASIAIRDYDGSTAPMSFVLSDVSPANSYPGYGYFNAGWTFSGITTHIGGDGKVHSVLGTADSSSVNYYLNGAINGTNASAGPPNGTTVLSIGRTRDGLFLDGLLYVLYFWSRALTANDAKWISAEPLAFLRPVVRRVYHIPTSTAVTGGDYFRRRQMVLA